MLTLAIIPVITCLLFGFLYPLCFWSNFGETIDKSFCRFNFGMSSVLGGVAVVLLWIWNVPKESKIGLTTWMLLFFIVIALSWNKEKPNEWVICLPCLLGAFFFIQVQNHLMSPIDKSTVLSTSSSQIWQLAASFLGGAVLALCVFAGVLGHWYLNVKEMPIRFLMKATNAFGISLLLRFFWDLYIFIVTQILVRGEYISLWQFLFTIEGIFLLVAILLGTIFPLILIPFIRETIKLHNTQSATGILYVAAISVFIGDLCYRYYLFRYGVAL